MQVHAVPEAERAFGVDGKRLPWAVEYADSKPAVQEKGPFGRSTRGRRTQSRSKTGTPSRKEDKDNADNLRAIDDIFNRAKERDQITQQNSAPAAPAFPITGSAVDATRPSTQPPAVTSVATEVILYGFPAAFQYAAIEFYERVSQGAILEDYERRPPTSKYDHTLSLGRPRPVGKLSKEALLKKNRYHGGDHWIKVTFESAEAAERACYASPHVVKGYIIYAETYRGVGPAEDRAIHATPAARQAISSATVSPSQRSSATVQQNTFTPPSDTATSATATAPISLPDPFLASTGPARSGLTPIFPGTTSSSSTALQSSPERPLRIRGAKRAVLLPAEQALLPASSRWQRAFGSWPLIGLLLGGGSDLIGDAVPRNDAGEFDMAKAGLYWLFWFWIDSIFGSDFCGLRGED
ncbi:hypothetical protein EJ08DRAFT_653478 [Tothia fuscella]|uniref:Uncharacterized protein n=1 Tax=Tothia fuscella TaxID=1048955 RepID=A0A9P4TTL3_9PEZI|nr:hypothetical protein EJ08DRAFT_653478 [Tothia fuscella]